jgi:Flp pilus assembly protein TadB
MNDNTRLLIAGVLILGLAGIAAVVCELRDRRQARRSNRAFAAPLDGVQPLRYLPLQKNGAVDL